MAPEVMNQALYDESADLWSVGCIIYEAKFGKPPIKTQNLTLLVKWHENPEIQWPPQSDEDCVNFLKGLLKKDPKSRLTWDEIKQNTYVKDYLLISEDNEAVRPLTQALTSSQQIQKNKQRDEIILLRSKKMIAEAMSKCQMKQPQSPQQAANALRKARKNVIGDNESISSEDSVNAIIQTDLETDVETTITTKHGHQNKNKIAGPPKLGGKNFAPPKQTEPADNQNFVIQRFEENFVTTDVNTVEEQQIGANANLRIGTMAENFQEVQLEEEMKLLAIKTKQPTASKSSTSRDNEEAPAESSNDRVPHKKDLEKRKLSQNLDNFSIRLGNSLNQAPNNEFSSADCEKDELREKSSR